MEEVQNIIQQKDKIETKELFDPKLQVVYRRVLKKYFLPKKKEKFIKRFYHVLIDLAPVEWSINDKLMLLSGFCTINYSLRIFFQASLDFIKENYGRILEKDVHEDIKRSYEKVVKQLLINKLSELDNDVELLERISEMPDEIALLVRKYLATHDINCSANCELSISFRKLDFDKTDKELDPDFWRFKDLYKGLHEKESNSRLELTRQFEDFNLRSEDERLEVARQKKVQNDQKRQLQFEEDDAEKKHQEQLTARDTQHAIFIQKQNQENELETFSMQHHTKKEKRKFKSDEIVLLKDAIEILKINKERKVEEQEIQKLEAEMNQKSEELRIKNRQDEIKAENIIQYEIQQRFLEILPDLVEKATRNQQPIEHMQVMQFASPNNIQGTPPSGVNNISDKIGELLQFKELLKFLDLDSPKSQK